MDNQTTRCFKGKCVKKEARQMSLESVWKEDQVAGKTLAEKILDLVRDQDGRVQTEDFISALAAIVAERCIEAAGDYEINSHDFAPGTRVFSDQVNERLNGNEPDSGWADIPPDSVFGLIWVVATSNGYLSEEFPPMKEIFERFVSGVPEASEWGRAPLSIPQEHLPRMLPIRVAYESRTAVDAVLAKEAERRLRASTFALIAGLLWVKDSIDHGIVLSLALETINAMSKTAPMTDVALAKVVEDMKKAH